MGRMSIIFYSLRITHPPTHSLFLQARDGHCQERLGEPQAGKSPPTHPPTIHILQYRIPTASFSSTQPTHLPTHLSH